MGDRWQHGPGRPRGNRFWLAFAGLLGAASASSAPPPNVVFITVDTFRPDHLGYYGYPQDTTPALDSLSREGVFFRQAFSSSAWTTPGLISLLTSLHAPTHGVDIRDRSLDTAVVTLPEAMIGAGYQAPDIFFLTEIPNFVDLGFQPYPQREEWIDRGDEILFHWLQSEGPQRQPFFLYYHYRDLHLPYNAGEPYESRYLTQAFASRWPGLGALRRFLAAEKLTLVRTNVMVTRGVLDFSSWDRPWVSALYDAEVRRLDDEVFARLRRTLAQSGLASNTLVVVSADHGEELLDHGLIGHVSTFKEGRLYDEVTRIPLVFWMPGRLPGGRVVEELVSCIDVMPTILELAQAPVPPGAQGRSLVPLLEGVPGWQSRPVFLETSAAGFMADPGQYRQRFRAVRTERWKLIHTSEPDAYTLYDLAADPGEQDDVSGAHPAVTDSLRRLLAEWVIYSQVRPGTPPAAGPVVSLPPAAMGEPLQVLFPLPGDTLRYQGAEHAIGLQWTGSPEAAYTVEYRIGSGAYSVSGELAIKGNEPRYGPFQPNVWNSLVLYNPWSFRVYPQGQPAQASGWVTFALGPAPDSTRSAQALATWPGLGAAAAAVLINGSQLIVGLARGSLDLYLWVGQIPAADLSAYALLATLAVAIAWPRLGLTGVRRLRRWSPAGLYIAFVYATVPVMPAVWDRLREYTQGSVRYLGIAAVITVALFVVAKVWQRHRGRRWLPYAALAALFAIYGYLLSEYAQFPSERLHLVEYGFVSVFLFRALRLDLSRRQAYLASFLLTALVGVGDECIQWVLPQRFFELKDIGLNALSGALGLLVLRCGLEPESRAVEAAAEPTAAA